jgi:hypothetical protein
MEAAGSATTAAAGSFQKPQMRKMKTMAKHHLLHDYLQMADALLGDFALHVSAKMDGNPNFTDPAVKPADLKAAAQVFLAAVAVCEDGTKQDTVHKNGLRAALIAMLDENLADVELTAKNDPEVMTSSGYNLANTTGTKPAPVGTVTISEVTNAGSGCLNLALAIGPNVWAIEVQASTAPGVWTPAGFFTDPRNVNVSGLTPGQVYTFRVRVHGSFNQVSDWSDPVSHMAM